MERSKHQTSGGLSSTQKKVAATHSNIEGVNMHSEQRVVQQRDVITISDVGTVPTVAVEFFAMFSRLEFALLSSGYSGGEVGDNAWVTWDSFGRDVHPSFFLDMRADNAVAVLFQQPARKLIKTESGDCMFADSPVPEDAVELLLQVRRIRNNLFHGSKVNFLERDRLLVHAAVRVLRHLLDALDKEEKTWKVRAAWAYAEVGSQ
ncbi:hypothetical protein CO655_12045 [Rhizobium sp. M1]|nr:hypothetical protein CO655_12045 [Rhizobium sp. M1]